MPTSIRCISSVTTLPLSFQDANRVRPRLGGLRAAPNGSLPAGQSERQVCGCPFVAAAGSPRPKRGIRLPRLTAAKQSLAGAVAAVVSTSNLRSGVASAHRLTVLLRPVLTLVLGAGFGSMLGNGQAPVRPSVLGWSRSRGQLRAANFVGVHDGQVLPLIGFPMTSSRVLGPAADVLVASLARTALWGAPLVQLMQGRR